MVHFSYRIVKSDVRKWNEHMHAYERLHSWLTVTLRDVTKVRSLFEGRMLHEEEKPTLSLVRGWVEHVFFLLNVKCSSQKHPLELSFFRKW